MLCSSLSLHEGWEPHLLPTQEGWEAAQGRFLCLFFGDSKYGLAQRAFVWEEVVPCRHHEQNQLGALLKICSRIKKIYIQYMKHWACGKDMEIQLCAAFAQDIKLSQKLFWQHASVQLKTLNFEKCHQIRNVNSFIEVHVNPHWGHAAYMWKVNLRNFMQPMDWPWERML